MTDNAGGWRNYQPTKGTLVWSFLGGVVATLVVGFAVFDWHTAGGAEAMARERAEQSRAALASAICVQRFMAEPDAAAQLAALKEEGTWNRDSFIEEGGWVTFARIEEPVSGAAELCADKLIAMEAPAEPTAASGTTEG